MKTPIDFGKDFLNTFFDQRDADACQKMLAGDLVWITPENMHHFLSEGAVLKYLRRQIKAQKESMYVDLISIKSSPSADNIMTVAYEINLVSSEEERPLYLRCSMVICRRGKNLEITFLHFSKKSERDSSEQLSAFLENLPCGIMILACLDGRREEAIFYNDYFSHRLRYRQEEFARAMARNPFFMAAEEDRDRLHEQIAEARKNGGGITANLRFYRRDGNSFYFRMKGAPAYQANGGTLYYCVFQETTGFHLTTEKLQSRLDSATEILRQIPEALCGIEYPPQVPAQKESAKEDADEKKKAELLPDESDGDVKIYRGRRKENNIKTGKTGPRVFYTSRNLPSMFGVSNSVYMKNILEDPFYGLEITSITRERLMSSHVLNPEKAATGKAVSCGIFRLRKPEQSGEEGIRIELVIRRVKDKDGTTRLYLFYYNRESDQQEMERRVERASKMGRAGQDQLRADLRKANETAARRQNELTDAMKKAEEKHTSELTRVENSLAEEKKRGVLMGRQLEEARSMLKQVTAERDRIEEDASRRVRNYEARAQKQMKEAVGARQLLEEQLREAQARNRALEQQLRREKARLLTLEEKYKLLEEQNDELRREEKELANTAPVLISETIKADMQPSGTSKMSTAVMPSPAPIQPATGVQSAAGVQSTAGLQSVSGVQSAAGVQSVTSSQSSTAVRSPAASRTARSERGSAPVIPAFAESREGDWMAKTEALTVFSAMDDFPEIEPAVDDFPEIAPARENVLKAEKFSPEAFLKSLVEYEETVCAEKGISLRLFEDSRLPSDVIGFAALLRRALYEIIENAISRARTGGTISIHCRADRPSGGIVNLYFTIDDNGADIPERGMQAIFDAGQRAESDTAVLPSLYAAQEAAALMGGSLDARSSAGITRFSLTVAVRVK